MIVIICAMSEERDAFLHSIKSFKKLKFEKLNYHGMSFDNTYYKGKIGHENVVILHSGVGKVYAAILTTIAIKKFKPDLVINVGVAGSLSKNIHVGDIVVATRIADWDVDVPGWDRSIMSDKISYAADGKFLKQCCLIKDISIKKGYIVSGDEFVYNKAQLKTIKKFFKDALCCEMEGSSIANTCYAFNVPFAIIRSISDETLVSNNYKKFDDNLNEVCLRAADLCVKIIKRY